MEQIQQKTIKDKLISINGQIDSDLAGEVTKKIIEINMDDKDFLSKVKTWANENNCSVNAQTLNPITILLNTHGGSVYNGMSIYDAIAASETPIEIICAGHVMSMGTIILLASNVRKAYKNTTFLIHPVSSWAIGTLQELKESVNETERVNTMIFSIIESRTKITKEMLNDIIEKKKDWFFTAEEALKLGLITEII